LGRRRRAAAPPEGVEAPAIAGLSLGGYTAFGIAAAHPALRGFRVHQHDRRPEDEAGKHRAPRHRDDSSRGGGAVDPTC
jgi:hypothetical protein